mgnify:CR=1 FL=1
MNTGKESKIYSRTRFCFEEIFDKFKHGGKLSTEELLLLQKYNIN